MESCKKARIGAYMLNILLEQLVELRLRPTVAAPLCELQGPHGRHGAPAQLRPATAGILTLTSGELRVTGCLRGNHV